MLFMRPGWPKREFFEAVPPHYQTQQNHLVCAIIWLLWRRLVERVGIQRV